MKVRLVIDRVVVDGLPAEAGDRHAHAAALTAALQQALRDRADAGVPPPARHAARLRLPCVAGERSGWGAQVAQALVQGLWSAGTGPDVERAARSGGRSSGAVPLRVLERGARS